jgi:hypothetical protein
VLLDLQSGELTRISCSSSAHSLTGRRHHQPKRELERWHRLFVLGEIDEQRLKRETTPLKKTLAAVERPQEVLDVEHAVAYVRDNGCALVTK